MRPPRIAASSIAGALAVSLLAAGPASAAEHPAGQPLHRDGMEVMGIYLQPVLMEPAMPDQDPARTDIHLEADIHALAGNKNGFPQDAWMPYLTVEYTLAKKGGAWTKSGTLEAMVANDGPHYGANVALDGPGAYTLVFHIAPPSPHALMRHVDKETGVAPWWKPFTYEGSFTFIGVGKKGGY